MSKAKAPTELVMKASVAEQEEDNECPICCYEYTHSLRSRVTCKCGFTICKPCARTHVLSSVSIATCINPECKIKWSDKFMNDNLNKSFMNKEYKNEKKKMLFEHQQSKFPETMPEVANYLAIDKLKDKRRSIYNNTNKSMKKKFEEKIIPLIEEIFEMEKEYYYVKCSRRSYKQRHNGDKPNCGKYICDGKADTNYKFNLFDHYPNRWRDKHICTNCGGYGKTIFKKDKAYHWREDSEGFINECRTEEYAKWERIYRRKMRKIDTEINKIEREKKSLNAEGREFSMKISKIKGNQNNSIEKKEIKKFIHACPKNDCRGFLSTQWKCGVCDSKVCKECFKIKNATSDKEHVCDPDDIETVKLIKSSTKPCPKCATAISKINGCDQMWCINCKVAFSWKKGTIVKGVIHNPHFYEWQKSLGKTQIRAPGDIVCGGIPGLLHFRRRLQLVKEIYPYDNDVMRMPFVIHPRKNLDTLFDYLLNIHRTALELEMYLNDYRTRCNNDNIDHKDLRVKYLANKITKKSFTRTLISREKKYKKELDLLHLYEIMVTVITESLNDICNITTFENVKTHMKQMEQIRVYFWDETQRIVKTYNMKSFYYINKEFKLRHYNPSLVKKTFKTIKINDALNKLINESGGKSVWRSHTDNWIYGNNDE